MSEPQAQTTEKEAWTYAPSLSNAPKHTIYGPRGEELATVYESKDRARLIAAAPELLEVLRKVRDQIDDPHLGSIDHQSDVALVSAIRIAVAKAEGRS